MKVILFAFLPLYIHMSKFWCSVENLNQIYCLALVYTEIFCWALETNQSETESKQIEERTLPHYFLLVNKPVKSAVKTFKYFLSCNGQSSDMSRIQNSARLVILVLV